MKTPPTSEPSNALRGLKGKPSNLDWPLLSQQHCSPLFVALPETTYSHSNRPSTQRLLGGCATCLESAPFLLVISHPSFLLRDLPMFNCFKYLIILRYWSQTHSITPESFHPCVACDASSAAGSAAGYLEDTRCSSGFNIMRLDMLHGDQGFGLARVKTKEESTCFLMFPQ